MTQGLEVKLQSVPLVDGKPGFDGIGEPKEVAMRWAKELKLTEEDMLDSLLKHVEIVG